jgi:hypothetical protein
MCLFRKYQLQGLRSRQNRSLLIVNEDFGGERNTANGILWTDTNYINSLLNSCNTLQSNCLLFFKKNIY